MYINGYLSSLKTLNSIMWCTFLVVKLYSAIIRIPFHFIKSLFLKIKIMLENL